jgi:hypothetical protein
MRSRVSCSFRCTRTSSCRACSAAISDFSFATCDAWLAGRLQRGLRVADSAALSELIGLRGALEPGRPSVLHGVTSPLAYCAVENVGWASVIRGPMP